MLRTGPAAAAIPDPTHTICPRGITFASDGSACFDVTIRDFIDNPCAGVTVAVDFGSCPVTFCPSQPHTGNRVLAVTGFSGVAHFCICATAEATCSANIYADGVPVCSPVAPQLRVDIVGRDSIRANYPAAFDLVINNQGSDAADVPLWISGIPLQAKVDLGFPLATPYRAPGEPDWSLDSLTFTSATGRYLALVIPRVPPGVTSRRINLTVPSTVTSFSIRAALTPPWVDDNIFGTCLVSGGAISNEPCMETQLFVMNDTLAAHPEIQAMSGIGMWAKIGWQCEGATSLTAAQNKSRQALGYMKQLIEQGTAPSGCGDVLLPRWVDVLRVVTASSLDPNDKLTGRKRLSIGQQIPYTIQFENDSIAAYAAHHVQIVDNIDISRLDPQTIDLGPIVVAGVPIPGPGQVSSFGPTYVQLRPTMSVKIQGTVDRGYGFITWDFTSVDPVTHQETPNDSGFLLANRYPPLGQGSVMFYVKPLGSLATGTSISNVATLIFDSDPTPTPGVTSTVDRTPPTSVMNSGSPPSNSAVFPVSWHAVGSPTDLKDFTIYVSENDGASWSFWKQTVETSGTYFGRPGTRYSFYCTASDTCNNYELKPQPHPEDSVRVTTSACLPTGMVAWWPGGNNAIDATGAHNGTVQNGATFAAGRVGQAFSLDGVNDYVSVPHHATFNFSNAMTIEGWVKPTNGVNRYIITKGEDSFFLAVGGHGVAGNQLSFNLNNVSAGWLYGTSNLVTGGQWHHVAATYDGATIRLYVDGNLESSFARSGIISTGPSAVTIGARSGANYFAGLVDELAVYDHELNALQIKAIYNAGGAGRCALVAVDDLLPSAPSVDLAPPWPNPAEQSVNLEFVLPASAVVHAEVLDVAGRRVAPFLANGVMTAGTHRLQWNGRDAAGRRVAPGVYLLRIATGTTVSVRRFVLIN
jgi:hypothetical protein